MNSNDCKNHEVSQCLNDSFTSQELESSEYNTDSTDNTDNTDNEFVFTYVSSDESTDDSSNGECDEKHNQNMKNMDHSQKGKEEKEGKEEKHEYPLTPKINLPKYVISFISRIYTQNETSCLSPRKDKDSSSINRFMPYVNVTNSSYIVGDYGNFFKSEVNFLYQRIEQEKVTVRPKIIVDPKECRDIDSYDTDNILRCRHIAKDIHQSYEIEELRNKKIDFMEYQTNINMKTYENIVNWIVIVCRHFGIFDETLYLSVHLVKEYLSYVNNIEKGKLQLLGITCMFIANKFSDIKQIEAETFVELTANAYTVNDVKVKEIKVLTVLNFRVFVPTIYNFICRYIVAGHCDRSMTMLVFYITKRSLQEYSFHKYMYSEITSASIMISREVFKRSPWSYTLVNVTNYTEEHIKPIADHIRSVIKNSDPRFDNVYRIFSEDKYENVAKLLD